MLVRAFGVAGDALEMRLDLWVVIDLEMIGGVNAPPEVVISDLILAEIRDIGRLRRGKMRHQQDSRREGDSRREPAQGAVAHVSSPQRIEWTNGGHLTASGLTLAIMVSAAGSKARTDGVCRFSLTIRVEPRLGVLPRILRLSPSFDSPRGIKQPRSG